MDNNSLSIDLKKLRKNLPPPPVQVPPPIAEHPVSAPPVQVSAPPKPAAPREMAAPMLPPKPRRGIIGKIPMPGFSLRNIIIVVVILAVLGAGYYVFTNLWSKSPFGPTKGDVTQAATQSAPSTPAADMTEAQIVEEVGKIMLLPSGESPTLAKVSDPAVLQSQAFFKNAAVGDIVIMYPKSLRAILYDPMQNKIIEVGPITAASTTATSTSK